MVLPVIAAAGARVAGTATARAGASTIARTGARAAARGTSNAAQKGAEFGSRNVVRTRRNPGASASGNRISSRPSSANVTRARNSAQGQNIRSSGTITSEEGEEENYEGGQILNSQKKTKPRIGTVVALILLFIAGMLDVIELVLDVAGTFGAVVGVLVGVFKDVMTILFFPAIFWILGAPFWKGRKAKKKMAAMLIGFIVAAVPWVGAFMPETLISVFITIYYTRVEDKQGDPTKSMGKNISRAQRIGKRFGK